MSLAPRTLARRRRHGKLRPIPSGCAGKKRRRRPVGVVGGRGAGEEGAARGFAGDTQGFGFGRALRREGIGLCAVEGAPIVGVAEQSLFESVEAGGGREIGLPLGGVLVVPDVHRRRLFLGAGRRAIGRDFVVGSGFGFGGNPRNFIRHRAIGPQRERRGEAARGGVLCRGPAIGRRLVLRRGGHRGLGGVEQRQEARPVARDDLREHRLARLRARLRHAVEPREHREAEPRVGAAALGKAAAVLAQHLDRLLLPPDRAVEQLVGEPRPRNQHGRRAADAKRRALGPLLQLIDGGRRHADLRRRNLHRPVGGESLQKFALETGCPMVAGGGGEMRGIVRGVVRRFILSVG